MRDTIFAAATAAGRAAVAVLRISGPGTRIALEALAGRLPRPRLASVRRLRGAGGEMLDQGLVLWFPGPGSYTGEDMAELQIHGGPAVTDAISARLLELGLRPAEAGEFTRRAFEEGKLDLDQAEAVADLVDAETKAQARQALDQLNGSLGRRWGRWRSALIEALAWLEAAVDFPDEEPPADVAARSRPIIEALAADLRVALADAPRGERVREGYRIALVGAPNAGKSRLLNALAGRDAAIVAATAGTTRDVIETPLLIGGYKTVLADMAGLRDTAEEIEAEGVRRAKAWAEAAALRLWVVDASGGDGRWAEAAPIAQEGDVLVLGKSDLASGLDAEAARSEAAGRGLEVRAVSALTGAGIEGLRALIGSRLAKELGSGEFPAVTRARHAGLLKEALGALERSLGRLEEPELSAEDLRLATRSLEQVTGRIGAEDVLDVIFASFCIGK
jgi:tRNA modification GTPase